MPKVLMLISTMKGGGAERVAALLLNEFHRNGYDAEYMLTSCKVKDAVKRDLDPDIPLTSLLDIVPETMNSVDKVKRVISSAVCKPLERAGYYPPMPFVELSFDSQNGRVVEALRQKLINEPETTVIAFLQPAIPILMLAARGLPNKVIFSERADPYRLLHHRYGKRFIEKYYTRADAAVFQTYDAKEAYPDSVSQKGVVISNPIKDGLPAPYHGERNKYITTFCRISKQKNLPVLLYAFIKLHKEHPDYILRIIGDTINSEGDEVLAFSKSLIANAGIGDYVRFEPFMKEVHSAIIKDAMYVNSSDYEGISNAMLESMAIGMPVVCTDCPIGGAKATITDGENGLLVPVGDSDALYLGMKRIIEDKELSDKLSRNAAELRTELSLEKIASKWMELF